MPTLIPVCTECGSSDITKDANAIWNIESQCWELCCEFDQSWCNACDGETSLDWKELEE